VAALLLAATAFAGSGHPGRPAGGLDRGFARHGVLRLEPPLAKGARVEGEREFKAAPDGSTYVSEEVRPCRGCPGFPDTLLFRFGPDGRPDRSFGGKGYVKLDPLFGGSRLAVDSHSRPIISSGEKGTRLERFTRGGRVDRSFGGDGKVWLPTLVKGRAEVEPIPGGGLLAFTEDIDGGGGFTPFRLAELREGGAPVAKFGHDGHAIVDLPGTFHVAPAVDEDGSILIAATGCCVESFTLERVTARGRLDNRFAAATRKGLRALNQLKSVNFEAEPEVTQVLERPDGGADLFGYFEGELGFDARVGADGGARPGFGRRGLRRLAQPVDQAVALRGGGFLAIGQGNFGPSRAFVLRPGGKVDRRFGEIDLAGYSQFVGPVPIGGRALDVAYTSRSEVGNTETPFVACLLAPTGEEPLR
jgi:hypothetical protein